MYVVAWIVDKDKYLVDRWQSASSFEEMKKLFVKAFKECKDLDSIFVYKIQDIMPYNDMVNLFHQLVQEGRIKWPPEERRE
mgnify:CR=1 FL=1